MLGTILLEGASLLPRVAEQLVVNDFYTEAHREIYGVMLTMGAAGQPIDVITLVEELSRRETLAATGGPMHLALLLEQASIQANLGAYVAIIREKAVLREMIQVAALAVAEAFDERQPSADLLERTRRRIETIAARVTVAEAIFSPVSAAELLAAAIPDPEFHVDGWIPTKGITFIVGDSEAFKSWFAMYLGFCKAAGRQLFDRIPVKAGPVLMVSEENGVVEDRRRLDLLGRGMGFDVRGLPFYIASETSFSFDEPARYAALRGFVTDEKVELVIVDSFVRVHRREEKDAGQMNALYMDRMKPLIRAGVDLVLLHHKRKLPAGLHPAQAAQGSSDSDDIRGSGDLRAAAHAVLFLRTQSRTQVVVRHNKARGFRKQDPFVFSLADRDGGGVVLAWEGKPEEALDKSAGCKAAILEYAAEHPPGFFRQDVVTALKGKFSRRVVDAMLKALAKDGVPLKADELKHGRATKHFYTYVSPEPDAPEPGDADDVPF